MSKSENDWYLVGATISTVEAHRKQRRSHYWSVLLWVMLAVLFLSLFQLVLHTGLPSARDDAAEAIPQPGGKTAVGFPDTPAVLLIAFGVSFALIFGSRWWGQRRWRRAFFEALQHPGPEKLIEVSEQATKKARLMPDGDALIAQSTTFAYALYGREAEATRALAEVNWSAKAPLFRALGLACEGIVELLCRRDVPRSSELSRRAREMGAVTYAKWLAGKTRVERLNRIYEAVGEALSNTASPLTLKLLEESAADDSTPALKLFGTFGLAVAMEHSGNAERARRLRENLTQLAPHCAPLHLKAADFPASGQPAPWAAPVSSSLSSPTALGAAGASARAAKWKLFKVVATWGGLIALFYVLRLLAAATGTK